MGRGPDYESRVGAGSVDEPMHHHAHEETRSHHFNRQPPVTFPVNSPPEVGTEKALQDTLDEIARARHNAGRAKGGREGRAKAARRGQQPKKR